MGVEKDVGVTGTHPPDYADGSRRKSTEMIMNDDPEREADFMTRNGLNLKSFQRRMFCEASILRKR